MRASAERDAPMTKIPSAGGWSRSVLALCSPKDQQHSGNTLRGSEGFVPALCIADGADNAGETTTIPLVKISLPCGVSKPIC